MTHSARKLSIHVEPSHFKGPNQDQPLDFQYILLPLHPSQFSPIGVENDLDASTNQNKMGK